MPHTFGPEFEIEAMITVKAYPTPSTKYGETCCLAGVRLDTGEPHWCRLYPVDFRGLPRAQQFAKYDVIRCRVRRPSNDSRPESLCPIVDTIEKVGELRGWERRWRILKPLVAGSMCEIYARERESGTSLGLFKPGAIRDFTVEKVAASWDEGRAAALNQQSFFTVRRTRPLEKIPYKFSFRYRCAAEGCNGHEQELIDWELAQYYRNTTGDEDERLDRVRDRWLNVVCGPQRDAHFFTGSLRKYHHSFVLLGVFWPRKASLAQQELALFPLEVLDREPR